VHGIGAGCLYPGSFYGIEHSNGISLRPTGKPFKMSDRLYYGKEGNLA